MEQMQVATEALAEATLELLSQLINKLFSKRLLSAPDIEEILNATIAQTSNKPNADQIRAIVYSLVKTKN